MDNKTKNELLGIIRALSLLPCARPFLKPVDTVALCIPDYLEIIQKPIDLGTIKKKLMNKSYDNTDQYLEDIYQIFDNCRKYNTDPRNPVRLLCEDLQTQFEFQWKMYEDRKKPEGERPERVRIEEKIPIKREIEHVEVKKVKKVKIKEEENPEEPKPKEKIKKKIEVEYQEELNFDKLTGKDDFESVIKFKVPEIVVHEEPPQEDAPLPAKIESIEYMKAALTPLVELASRPLLRNTLINAIYTVSQEMRQ
jgi:bromodomain-containing factor 1